MRELELLERMCKCLERLEGKLDELLAALADTAEAPAPQLDGTPSPPARPEGQPL